jgi:glycolate oxidase
MRSFARVTPALLERLAGVVGPGQVRVDDAARERYGQDETEDLLYPPEAVVRPATTAEVAAVLTLAHEAGVPVTPRGAGSGLSGGALPVFGGLVLTLERMDRILELDLDNRMLVAQPGVLTGEIHRRAAEHGLMYAPDPASSAFCCLGGNLAENAAGPRAVKYGLTKDHVLALEAVRIDGGVFRTGGKLKKDVAGYDLTRLLIGSEGTLAVITEATLRLLPLPQAKRLLLVPFASLEAAAQGMVAVYRSAVTPSALEIMERSAIVAAARHLGRHVPGQEAAALLYVEVDGMSEAEVAPQVQALGEVLLGAGADDVLVAETPQRAQELWSVRKAIGEAVRAIGPYVECDTAVSPTLVPRLLAGVRAVAERHGVHQISYGHAGDGNIHVNVLTGVAGGRGGERERLEEAIEAILRVAVDLGGTITGEHGVGCAQMRHLPLCRDPVALDLMRAVKHAFDPRGLLNPGKVLDEPIPRPQALGVGNPSGGARPHA